MVKNLPPNAGMSQEDPLKEEMATPSSILAWKIPWTEKPGRLQSIVSQRIRHNWTHTHIHSESINCRLIQNNYSLLLCNWGISSVSFNSDIVYFLLWKAKCRNELFKHSETVITHHRFCSLRSELPSSHGSQRLNKGDWQRGKWRLKSGSHSAPPLKHTSISPEKEHLYCYAASPTCQVWPSPT